MDATDDDLDDHAPRRSADAALCAVHLLFDAEPRPLDWTFARELLAAGPLSITSFGGAQLWVG